MIKLVDILKEVGLNEADATDANLLNTIEYLQTKERVLLLPCSNRYNWDSKNIDVPKSTLLAQAIEKALGERAVLIDVPTLNIVPCEGNVSRKDGNSCGLPEALLKDREKNPSGYHRCWASINEKSDELWKISKELFESDTVVFFSSIRWGQANMYYQKLIERLTWIENRYHTLGEENLLENIESGFICVGQNWNGTSVVDTQKKVHEFYGFKPNNNLYWNWQYTEDVLDETKLSYEQAYGAFQETFKLDQ